MSKKTLGLDMAAEEEDEKEAAVRGERRGTKRLNMARVKLLLNLPG